MGRKFKLGFWVVLLMALTLAALVVPLTASAQGGEPLQPNNAAPQTTPPEISPQGKVPLRPNNGAPEASAQQGNEPQENAPESFVGRLEICKTIAGMNARWWARFGFNVSNVAFTLGGGQCAVFLAYPGTYTIGEYASSANFTLTGVTVNTVPAQIGANHTVTATVTSDNVTRVVFTNTFSSPGPVVGKLRVCKEIAGTGAANFAYGRVFGFTVAGRVFSLPAGGCALFLAYPGEYTVAEYAPGANFDLTGVSVNGGPMTNPGPNRSGTVAVVAGQEASLVFTNTFSAPTGYIQICKVLTAAQSTDLTFNFISNAFAGTQSVTVPHGDTRACGSALAVRPTGPYDAYAVYELPKTGWRATSFAVEGTGGAFAGQGWTLGSAGWMYTGLFRVGENTNTTPAQLVFTNAPSQP